MRSAVALAVLVFAPILALACGDDSEEPQAGPPGGSSGGPEGGAVDEAGNPIVPGSDSGGPPVDAGSGRGFPEHAPWVSYYGTAQKAGDLDKLANTFRIINIEADPGLTNWKPEQIAKLKLGGKNRVISYMNVGACESFRSYWKDVPAGFVSCNANTAAKLGDYHGFPNEQWMDPSNADYQKLIVDHVATRLAATGVDGFFLDNLELLEHKPNSTNGPCSAACRQGGFDLVRKLREKFPNLLFVQQNATGEEVRTGMTGGVPYPSLLDGISHEDIYEPSYQKPVEEDHLKWRALGFKPGGREFWLGTEDFVGDCNNSSAAKPVYDKSRAKGFSPYVTDESGGQQVICYWGF